MAPKAANSTDWMWMLAAGPCLQNQGARKINVRAEGEAMLGCTEN